MLTISSCDAVEASRSLSNKQPQQPPEQYLVKRSENDVQNSPGGEEEVTKGTGVTMVSTKLVVRITKVATKAHVDTACLPLNLLCIFTRAIGLIAKSRYKYSRLGTIGQVIIK